MSILSSLSQVSIAPWSACQLQLKDCFSSNIAEAGFNRSVERMSVATYQVVSFILATIGCFNRSRERMSVATRQKSTSSCLRMFQSLQGAHVRCNLLDSLVQDIKLVLVSIAPWSACPLQRPYGLSLRELGFIRFQSLQGAHARCNIREDLLPEVLEAMFQSLQGAHVRCNLVALDLSSCRSRVSIAPGSACPLQRVAG